MTQHQGDQDSQEQEPIVSAGRQFSFKNNDSSNEGGDSLRKMGKDQEPRQSITLMNDADGDGWEAEPEKQGEQDHEDKFQFKNPDDSMAEQQHEVGDGGMMWNDELPALADPGPQNPNDDISDDTAERMIAINQINSTEAGVAPSAAPVNSAPEEDTTAKTEGENTQPISQTQVEEEEDLQEEEDDLIEELDELEDLGEDQMCKGEDEFDDASEREDTEIDFIQQVDTDRQALNPNHD